MPGKDQLDLELPPPDGRLPEGVGKPGFDEFSDAGNDRENSVHVRSVHMNELSVKIVI